MNRAVFCVVALSVASVLLSGCAAHSASVSGRVGYAGLDNEYINLIERRAAIAGVSVKWINPPTKSSPEQAGDPGGRP